MRKTIKMFLIICLTKHAMLSGSPKAKDYHLEVSRSCRKALAAISLVIN